MTLRKPLTGIRVLDFTRMYAGPFCTMQLGDLGADVVKLESPDGDPVRRQGPPFHKGLSMTYISANRCKRSIVIDLRQDAGRKIAFDLACQADVLVENFRPGVMDRLGFGYEALSKANSKLVYAAMSGMGADGPDSDMGAFDLTIQAVGGFMSITGEPGGKAIKLGTSVFDLVCGQYASSAVLAALFDRARTGKGQKVETSLLESEVAFLVDAAMEYLLMGNVREKWGSEHSTVVPYKAFKANDGWLVVGCGTQGQFEEFVRIVGMPQLAADPRFMTMTERITNRVALYEILDEAVANRQVGDILAALNNAGVPCAPVNNIAQVFQDRQVLHRGMVQKVIHPAYGEIAVIGPAVKYSAFDITEGWSAPPLLGEHSHQVLGEWLELPAADIDTLAAQEVI